MVKHNPAVVWLKNRTDTERGVKGALRAWLYTDEDLASFDTALAQGLIEPIPNNSRYLPTKYRVTAKGEAYA